MSPTSTDGPEFSPLEIGLLTVVERRGSIRTPRQVDERNNPLDMERLTVLRRLVERGLVSEAHPVDDASAVEIEFVITEAGRSALVVADSVVEADRA